MHITVAATQSLRSPTLIGRISPILKELHKKGVKIKVFLLHHDYKNVDDREINIDGIDFEYIGPMAVVKKEDGSKTYYTGIKLLLNMLHSTFKMFTSLLFQKTDILFISKPHPHNLIPAVLVKILKRKKVVLDSDDYEAYSNKTQNNFQKNILKITERIGIKFCDAIIVCSPYLQDHYARLGVAKNKIFLIPTGIDVDNNRNELLFSKKEFLKKYKIDSSPKIILYCGSVSIKSGHSLDILLKAFQKISQELNDVLLVLVGSGEDTQYLKNLADELGVADKAIFTGRFKPEEIGSFINLADVVVDPVDDSLANKAKSSSRILEAMYGGKPVVAGDVGIRKYLLKGNGLLVKPNSPEELSGAIERIFEDRDFAKNIVRDSKKHIKFLEWPELVKKLFRILNNLGKV